MRQLHIHALGINTGGGLVLLRQLLAHNSSSFGRLILDQRIFEEFKHFQNAQFFERGLISEIKSQFELKKVVSKEDHILFFSNRPPIVKFPCKVSVFHQNAAVLNQFFNMGILGKISHLWFKLFKHNADQFIVQNQTMRKLLSRQGCINTSVRISPFFDFTPYKKGYEVKNGFIYVASFASHKNHTNLIKAWEYLIYHGVKERLKLIVSGFNSNDLVELVNQSYAAKFIDVITEISSEDVLKEYDKHKALIFPSTRESFGLPLLEAKNCKIPIIASELDFVRDIIEPDQSFDPKSYISIARSVMRFLKVTENKSEILTSEDFVNSLLEKTKVSIPKAS